MILKFQSFINEKLGIAIPSIRYNQIILEKVEDVIIDFVNSNKNNLENEIKIERNELSSFFGSLEEYMKFPINEIKLLIDLKKFKKSYESKKFYCGGGAFSFGHKNWKNYSRVVDTDENTKGLNIILLITLEIEKGYSYNEDVKSEIESTIWHETNHLYEMYNRFKNLKGRVIDRSMSISLSYLDKNIWKIKSEIFNFWDVNFTYLIYRSDKSEMNANVQESAYIVGKYNFDKVLKSEIWKMANKLKNFNKEEFIIDLEEEIKNYYNEDQVDFIKDRLKRMTIKIYKDNLKEFKEKPNINIQNLENSSFDKFIEFFEKRFNKSGDLLKRKIIKLKSIEDEKVQ